MLRALDTALFRAINGLAGRRVWLDAIFIFGATHLIFVMAALVISYAGVAWKTSSFEDRIEDITHVLVTVGLAYVIQVVIGFLYFRPRPFAALAHVVKLIDRSPLEKSFPSTHASLAFAMAFGLLMHNPKWGTILVVLACLVGFSRVYVGVHYPSDIIGGIIVAGFAALVTVPVKKTLGSLLDWFPVFGKTKK